MQLPDLLATRYGRLTAFALLYVTEGIPLGFTATAVATQMRRQGVEAGDISYFVGTLYLPWAFKWVMGPVVDVISSDRWGRRRVWIVGAQILMSLTLLAGMPIDFKTQLMAFTGLIFVHNIFGATQDVAIDALACNVLPEEERGIANGLMFGGAYLGQTIGGSLVLFLSEHIPFRLTYLFVVGCLLSVTVFIALPLREPKSPMESSDGESKTARVARELRTYFVTAVKSFGNRQAFLGLLFALLPTGAYSLSMALQSNLAVELGLIDREIAILALFSTVLSAGGCILGGKLSDRYGRRSMLAVYVSVTSLPVLWLAYAMHSYGWIMPVDIDNPKSPIPTPSLIYIFWFACLIFSVLHGLMYGTRTALFMDVTNPVVAATQFTAYMAVLNLVIAYTGFWQGWTIKHLGYPATLTIDALVGLIGLTLLPWIKRNHESSQTV